MQLEQRKDDRQQRGDDCEQVGSLTETDQGDAPEQVGKSLYPGPVIAGHGNDFLRMTCYPQGAIGFQMDTPKPHRANPLRRLWHWLTSFQFERGVCYNCQATVAPDENCCHECSVDLAW